MLRDIQVELGAYKVLLHEFVFSSVPAKDYVIVHMSKCRDIFLGVDVPFNGNDLVEVVHSYWYWFEKQIRFNSTLSDNTMNIGCLNFMVDRS
jgi:hypothetical protein